MKLLKYLFPLILLGSPAFAQPFKVACVDGPPLTTIQQRMSEKEIRPIKTYDGQFARDFAGALNSALGITEINTDVDYVLPVVVEDRILVMTFKQGCGVQAFAVSFEIFALADSQKTATEH